MVPLRLLAGSFLALTAASAQAQDYGDPEGRTLTGLIDVRLTASDGERSWIDGGFGKARFGGPSSDSDRFRVRSRATEADLVWQPQITWALGATIAATAQAGQENAVDLSEAFLSWRRDPHGSTRLSARAGLFWPPVSLEHGGTAWSVTETITPSAINSWIGEEVKVTGAEGTASFAVAEGRLSATLGVFGFNDTAGTLLAFRGWALHDEKAVAFGHQPLPPLDAFMHYAQAPQTRPVIELDDRPGFYGKLAWNGAAPLKLQGFYYDNRGDPRAVNNALQWGWRTRFGNVGATLQLDSRTKLTSQGMIGTTQMGYPRPDRVWVDTRFRSAFLLATRRIGATSSVSGRVEAFGTQGRGSVLAAQTDEDGWALTVAGRHAVGRRVQILGEVLHIDSDRDDRARIGSSPRQRQTVMQMSLRAGL